MAGDEKGLHLQRITFNVRGLITMDNQVSNRKREIDD